MPDLDPLEIAFGLVVVLLSGAAVALILALGSARRRERRHRRLSAARRASDTRYDLLAEAGEARAGPSSRTGRRRRRANHSPADMIDILPKAAHGDGQTLDAPPGDPPPKM
jgi:type II secretory pathway pseudopilin PulG